MASPISEQDRLAIALALKRRQELILRECFDPANPDSKPTEPQLQVMMDFGHIKNQWIVAGNQCLAKGTLVATPQGPIAIEQLQPGDTVFDENAKPIKVLKTFVNGTKKVHALQARGQAWAHATAEHKWLTNEYSGKDKPTGLTKEQPTNNLGRYSKVCRQFPAVEMGTKRVKEAYVLGALLGDGCSTQDRKTNITISSADANIPGQIGYILGCWVDKCSSENYNWRIRVAPEQVPFYKEWCSGRKAHQKTCSVDELKTWDRQSLVQFVAGIFDTDGSLCGNEKAKTVRLSIDMQAKDVIDALNYLFLALWQVQPSLLVDARDKYVNGPLHRCVVTNKHDIKRILKELQPYVCSKQKHWKDIYDTYGKRSYENQVTLTPSLTTLEVETFDIHVDSPTNLYCLANGLITHNSGKSQTCSRIVAWVLEETHPYWTRPKEWGQEPLLILVAGRTGKQIEESLAAKITSYLPKGSYKEVRIGNILQKIEHINGNRIIFQSMENPETARERVQSYVAHLVWIDEMPPTTSLITELQVRTNSRDGYFMASFTPLVENIEIQKMVDSATEPVSKKYIFKMFDNPLYASKEKQVAILETMKGLPDAVVRTRLYGEWSQSERSVYFFDHKSMVASPPDYSPMWRHVEASDPAVQSKFGFTLWAEHPGTGVWYCIKDEYIEGVFVPDKILDEVLKRTAAVNIVRRICDPHEAWYLHTAAARGISYVTPFDKNSRKRELIKNLQQGLGTILRVAPWCTRLQEEFINCKWSDSASDKIVNASSYHLLDCAQYFMDCKPLFEAQKITAPWWEELRKGNESRKVMEAFLSNNRTATSARKKYVIRRTRW